MMDSHDLALGLSERCTKLEGVIKDLQQRNEELQRQNYVLESELKQIKLGVCGICSWPNRDGCVREREKLQEQLRYRKWPEEKPDSFPVLIRSKSGVVAVAESYHPGDKYCKPHWTDTNQSWCLLECWSEWLPIPITQDNES